MVAVHLPLKPVLKRGALVAAANWQITLIQAVADSLFKLLLAVPVVGGVFLVALVVGSEPVELVTLPWREMATTVVSSLLAHPVVLTAFLLALAVVVVGGSLFVFLIKGGAVAVLVEGERAAGPIEQPPLHVEGLGGAARFSIDKFIAAAGALFPRYARLGFFLMAVYLLSGGGYLLLVFASRRGGESWGMTALFTAAFVAWITIVNLLYLLMQIVIAADDCSVAAAAHRVSALLRRQRREVIGVFLVILTVVVAATGASWIATAALGLIGFIPLLGLAMVPIQLLAWLFRVLVFQFIGLTSIGAYARLYRES